MTNLYTQRCKWLVDWTFHSQLVVQPKAGSMCWKFPSGLPRDRFVHVRHSVETHTFWGQRNRMTSCNPWSTRRLWRSTRISRWQRPRRLCSGWIWFLGYLPGSGLHLCQTPLLPLTYLFYGKNDVTFFTSFSHSLLELEGCSWTQNFQTILILTQS